MADDQLMYWTTIAANLVTIGGALYGIPRALGYLRRSANAAERTAKAQEDVAKAAKSTSNSAFDWNVDLVYKMDASAKSLEDSGDSPTPILDALNAGITGNKAVLNRIDRTKLRSKAVRELIDLYDTGIERPPQSSN